MMSFQYRVLFVLITVVYIFGLFVDILEVDAAQYAAMAREMLETGNFFKVQHRYNDYLDKPPLLFWLSAISIKVFGVNNFAYKLPSFLFTFLGVYSTYKFSLRYYSRKVAETAALVLYSCMAYFLFNNDVRTDTLLTNSIMFAIWQISIFLDENKWRPLLLGFVGIGLAMLAKGPIGILMPIYAFGSHLVFKRQWKKIFQWKWLVGLFIVALMLTPMVWGLYEQYGSKGPRFYFWTQSFGRITGENVWSNDASFFFFWHTFIWAFLPWSFLFIYAILKEFGAIVRSKFSTDSLPEYIALFGFTLTFLSLCVSHYKLPHYIFVTFPLASVVAAKHLVALVDDVKQVKWLKFYSGFHMFVVFLLWAVIVVMLGWFFPAKNILLVIVLLFAFACSLIAFIKAKTAYDKLILPVVISITSAALVMNTHFYPELIRYQFGTEAAHIVEKERKPDEQILIFLVTPFTYDYYLQTVSTYFSDPDLLKKHVEGKHGWLVTNAQGNRTIMKDKSLKPDKTFQLNDFSITYLSLPFLIPNTRQSKLDTCYLYHY